MNEVELESEKGPATHQPQYDRHNEAAVPEGYEVLHIDAAVERRVRRKIDLNLMPMVMALYLLASLDRSNIGNAEAAGMSTDLGESDAQYEWLLTVFYIPYILFEWMALMWKVVPPHIWACVTVLVWGLAASLQAAAKSWAGMMAARCFMAAAEAAYGPGIPYLLSFFYLRSELGFRCGIFLSAAPLATCFAGALAYGITSGHPAIASWRLLFLVEGLPTIVMAGLAFLFIPDSPDTAKFLNEEERLVAKARALRQTGSDGRERIGSVNFKEVGQALLDVKNWLTAFMYFSCNVSFASLPVFLPTILEGLGFTSINAQGLTAPPYFLSFLFCLITTYVADRTRQRGFMIFGLSIMAGIGYVLLATVKGTGVRYFAIFLAAAGVFPAISNILPWVLNNQGTDSKRGTGIALLQMVGQCGPVLGTRVFPTSDGPYYVTGMSICAAFMFFNGLLAIALRTYMQWENKRWERHEREMEAAGQGGKGGDIAVENEGWGYRNTL